MEMTRQDAEDMAWVLSTVLGHHLVVDAIREAGAGDKVFAAAKRLEQGLGEHWKRTGDSLDHYTGPFTATLTAENGPS